MIVVLNELGYINLNKALINFEKFYEFYKASTQGNIITDFLKSNSVFLNHDMQITDGMNIFGLVKYKN